MEEGFEKKEDTSQEIFSKSVRAGKRTYFFDVKATRNNDYYLTITESKKRFNREGRYFFEKHKIFLYKEDFEKFADGLSEVVTFIRENRPLVSRNTDGLEEEMAENYSEVEFEDLESEKA